MYYTLINSKEEFAELLSCGFAKSLKDPWGQFNAAFKKYSSNSLAFEISEYNKFAPYAPACYFEEKGHKQISRERAKEIIKESFIQK